MSGEATAALPVPRPDAGFEPLRIGDRFEIMVDQPLGELNGLAGPAFAARGLRNRKADAYAMVCSGQVPPRSDSLPIMISIAHPALTAFLDWGVIEWPVDRSRRLALVFARPPGRRWLTALPDRAEPVTEEQLGRLLIQPVASMLKELSGRGLTHGGIRPTNLFVNDAAGHLVVGECVSTPPGYAQPAIFETIERMMAHRAARGPGTILDDLYSLGVSALYLAFGHPPAATASDDELLTQKIDRGSFAALAGTARLSQGTAELLRGLLNDDPVQRWSLNQIELWLSGRRLTPKQAQPPRRASRPLEVAGREIWHCRAAARALLGNVGVAISVIESGELDRWLRRSLSDETMAEAVAAAATSNFDPGKTSGVAERLVTRISIALDPAAPIRYRGQAAMPDGIGGGLADAFLRRDTGQGLAELLAWQMPAFWTNAQAGFRAEFVPMIKICDAQRAHLESTAPGHGIERVLYEMNPNLPCLSPQIANRYVLTPLDLLQALDQVAQTRDRGREPLDRHITAFLAARLRRADDALYAQLAQGVVPLRRSIAILTILNEIQLRFDNPPLPGLCAWMVELLGPALQRFANRPQREKMQERAAAAAKAGRLAELLRLVDDPEAIRRDQAGFIAAERELQRIVHQIDRLKQQSGDRAAIERTTGRHVAAIVASVVATALIGGISLIYLGR